MSDRPTPETDAAFRKGMNGKQVFEFAERLERERDEAREVLKEIAEAIGFDNIGNWARNKALEALKTK
jgi:hypothetical protein